MRVGQTLSVRGSQNRTVKQLFWSLSLINSNIVGYTFNGRRNKIWLHASDRFFWPKIYRLEAHVFSYYLFGTTCYGFSHWKSFFLNTQCIVFWKKWPATAMPFPSGFSDVRSIQFFFPADRTGRTQNNGVSNELNSYTYTMDEKSMLFFAFSLFYHLSPI